MMNLKLLPYLGIKDIVKLSMSSKRMRMMIEPVNGKSYHLKNAAAVQLLGEEDLKNDLIDEKLGYTILLIKDLSELRESKVK